ncbi:hypothetical protein K474DRAFT_101770 [Panus rudis PR-1116 ss-1]|nr:hypothetical protein K474DRAFT_101770 [Panus rudis PR-1116 ss-1]
MTVQDELADAIANAQQNPLSDEQAKNAMDAISSQMEDNNDQLIDDIKALAGYCLEIEQAFEDVDAIFRKIQLTNVSQGLKDDVEYLRTKWGKHKTRYTELIWDSRKVAGAAQAAADDFATDFATFLGEEGVDINEKKQEIANYIAKLTEDEKVSADMSQGFTDLQKAVQAFQDDWGTIVGKYNLDDLNDEAQKIQAEIDALVVTLQGLESQMEQLAIALGILAVVATGTAILGFLCPAFWVGTILSVIGVGVSAGLLAKARQAYDDANNQLRDKRSQLSNVMADIAAVEQLKAGLENSKGNFDVIVLRLGAFAKVWATLRADIQAIEEKLEYAHSTNSWTLMKARLKTASALYAALGRALRQYQISVNSDNAIFQQAGLNLQ